MTTMTTANQTTKIDGTGIKLVEISRHGLRATYEVRSAWTGRLNGYLFRTFSYRQHSDYGSRSLDNRRTFLGNNMPLADAAKAALAL